MRDDPTFVEQIQRDLRDVRWPEPGGDPRPGPPPQPAQGRGGPPSCWPSPAVSAVAVAAPRTSAATGLPAGRASASPTRHGDHHRRPAAASRPAASRSTCSSASRGWASRSGWTTLLESSAGRARGARTAGRCPSCPVRRPCCRSGARGDPRRVDGLVMQDSSGSSCPGGRQLFAESGRPGRAVRRVAMRRARAMLTGTEPATARWRCTAPVGGGQRGFAGDESAHPAALGHGSPGRWRPGSVSARHRRRDHRLVVRVGDLVTVLALRRRHRGGTASARRAAAAGSCAAANPAC